MFLPTDYCCSHSWVETLLRWRKVNAKTYLVSVLRISYVMYSAINKHLHHALQGPSLKRRQKNLRKHKKECKTGRIWKEDCCATLLFISTQPFQPRTCTSYADHRSVQNWPFNIPPWMPEAPHSPTLSWGALGSQWLPGEGRTTFSREIGFGELPTLK